MITYLDTSIILPQLMPTHANHARAKALVERLSLDGTVATTTLHTYGELYNNLTRASRQNQYLLPEIAELAIAGLSRVMQIVELSKEDYVAAVHRCATLQMGGPIIYDAVHYEAALKVGATTLYTENLRDFTRLPLPNDPPLKILGPTQK